MNNIFYRVWVARLISIFGSSLSTFGMSVWVYEQTGKATPMAITLLCGILPSIIFAPFSGLICDSYNRKKIIIMADTIAALTSLVFLFYLITIPFNLILICVITFLSSTANMFDTNAYQASIPTMLDAAALKKANGMNQIIDSLSSIIAPICASILYTPIGIKGLLLVDIGTYLVAMMIFVSVPGEALSDVKGIKTATKSEKNRILAGFNFIFTQKGLTLLMLFFAVYNFLLNIAFSLSEPLALSISNSMGLGLIKTFGGLGILFGSLYITTREIKISYSRGIFISVIVAGLAMSVMGLRNNIICVVIGIFFFYFVLPVVNTMAGTLWMLRTPKELQGRVFASRMMITKCIIPLAYISVGPLADYIMPQFIKKHDWTVFYTLGKENLNFRIVYIAVGIIALIVAAIFFSRKPLWELGDQEDSKNNKKACS